MNTIQPSSTPLSDLITECLRLPRAQQPFGILVEQFAHAKVCVIAIGLPADAEGDVQSTRAKPISLGLTKHGGITRILTFADPEAFAAKFGRSFSGEMLGADVYRTVAANTACHGILVNSATEEMSIIIDRAAALAYLDAEPDRERKPWWKFW